MGSDSETGTFPLAGDDIEALALGAGILGTGGGGSPFIAGLNLTELYRLGHRVDVVHADALADDAAIAVVSSMGAPLVGQERLTDPGAMVRAVELVAAHTGRDFDAVMPVEIGGANALAPFLVAALTGLPVVDADAMGRAFPEAQMTSFAIGGLSVAPVALVDVRGSELIVSRAPDARWMERLCRAVCAEVGSTAATCKAPRTGRDVREWGITGTVTAALALGKAVLAARAAHRDPVEAAIGHGGGRRLFDGSVVDVARETTGGFLRGRAVIAGLGSRRDQRLELDFRNEWAVARLDDTVVATTPDLLCVLDSVDGASIGTELLRYGQRVSVVALPSSPILRTPAGLAAVGPRAFGYDLDHVPAFTTPTRQEPT